MRRDTLPSLPGKPALALLCAALLCALAPAAAQAQTPSYEETLVFIEGTARYPLVEREKRCEFIYRDNLRFSAKDLNPMPVVNGWGAVFKCTQGKRCIDPRNTDKLLTEITVEARDMNNAAKLSRAVGHLIQLCGGAKARPDLF